MAKKGSSKKAAPAKAATKKGAKKAAKKPAKKAAKKLAKKATKKAAPKKAVKKAAAKTLYKTALKKIEAGAEFIVHEAKEIYHHLGSLGAPSKKAARKAKRPRGGASTGPKKMRKLK